MATVKSGPWSTRPETEQEKASRDAGNGETDGLGLGELEWAGNVNAERLDWLWAQRIPLGKFTLIVGDPGLGKSVLSIALAACVSVGGTWPDGSKCKAGQVMIMSAEDDYADTVRPRLDAAGADVGEVCFLKAVTVPDRETLCNVRRPVKLDEDVPIIRRTLRENPGIRLFVIDPFLAYMGRVDSYKTAEVRGTMTLLAELAAATRVAIVGIHHFNKNASANAIYRVSSSLAFVAAARCVHAVVKDKDNSKRRLLLPVKSNLGPDEGGLAFEVVAVETSVGPHPVLRWEGRAVQMSADEALQDDAAGISRLDEALEWLRGNLMEGPVKAEKMLRESRAIGISPITLRRAKDKLGIKSLKQEFSGKWVWKL